MVQKTKKAPKVKKTKFGKTVDRVPVTHKPRADNVRPLNARLHKTRVPPRVRPSLAPGTVLILVAGPYKGKRVVCLKALPSGNLMTTGPFQVNGFPLRRINARYVIATSTKVPLDGVDVSKYDDAFFNKVKKAKQPAKEKETVFMSQGVAQDRVLPEEKKRKQSEVDGALLKYLAKPENALLKQYLKTRFTLRHNMHPHDLKF